ncbi:protein IN2-1 homolog B isoform X2 [Ricinus communis]|uniref:protein IN2-1 homolog B isoform X2 n=1 Tax=Ricinus communis TaxID=3988 RepID=UPI00201A94A4|nr:protein IN2-1 homolog B isoform X2 [Ricinus communis]
MASLTVSSPLLTSPTLVSSHCSPRLISKRTARFSNTNSTIQLFSYSLQFQPLTSFHDSLRTSKTAPISATMATGIVKEVLPPALTSTSDPPPVFDGTTRLYISYTCPYAQRVWITRNCKGLQDLIKLVPIDLQDRPAWYKEKVYPPNKDPAKKDLAEELIAYIDSFNKALVSLFKGEANEAGAVLDFIETSLTKFDDGPLFLGQFSLVDIAYAPFIDRFQPALLDVRDYDITAGRPNLAAWIEEMNKNEAYNQTRRDPKEYVESYKRRFLAQL